MDDQQAAAIRELRKDHLDIGTLRLIALASEMTFAEAALRIGRTEWRAHVRVKQMEKQLGQKLFRKEGRRNVPTDACRVLIAYSRRILALNDEALTCLRSGEYVQDALWLRLNPEPKRTLPRIRTLDSQSPPMLVQNLKAQN